MVRLFLESNIGLFAEMPLVLCGPTLSSLPSEFYARISSGKIERAFKNQEAGENLYLFSRGLFRNLDQGGMEKRSISDHE